MKIVLQRVSEASVRVDGQTVGHIGRGLVMLVCAEKNDTDADAAYFAKKIAKLRIFADDNGKTNLSIIDVKGAALVVSQFTLAAEWRKGNRPGFSQAAPPVQANQLYETFCELLEQETVPVERGVFGANMSLSLINEGPFTMVMDGQD